MALKGKIYSIARQHDDLNTDELFQSMMIESTDKDTIVMDGRNIAAGSVFAEQIHAKAITAEKIDSKAITADHIDAGSIDVGTLWGDQLILPGKNYKGVVINNEGLSMKSTALDVTLSSSSGFNITDKHGNPLIDIDPSTGDVKMRVNQMSIGGYSATTTKDVDDIEIGGRNLIIRNTETPNRWIDTTGSLSLALNHDVSDYIKVEPSTNYMLTKSQSKLTTDAGFFRWGWYDIDMKFIGRKADSKSKISWETPNTAHYVRVSYPTDSAPKLEKGTKATDWTPAPEDVQAEIDSRPTFNDFDQIDKVTINGGNIRANTIKSTHIETNTATIDKIFADTAMVNHLTSKTAFIDNIKAIEIDAGKISSGTISAERLDTAEIVTNGLTADAIESTHIETSTATIDKLFANDATINTLTAKTAFIDSIKAVEIDADKITTGEMNGDRIKADTITADRITGRLPGDKLTLDGNVNITSGLTVPSANIGDLSANKITSGEMHGSRIQADTLSADRITGTIPGGKITLDGDVTVNGTFKVGNINISSGISAGKITTGEMHGSRIQANTISADRINTDTLSAITANLGTITAGTLRSQNGKSEFRLNDGVLETIDVVKDTLTRISDGMIEQRTALTNNRGRRHGFTVDGDGIGLYYYDDEYGYSTPSNMRNWDTVGLSNYRGILLIEAPFGVEVNSPYSDVDLYLYGGELKVGGSVSVSSNLTVNGTNVMDTISAKADKASSTNGYVMFEDGTLIQWHTELIATQSDSSRLDASWKFTVQFTSKPAIVAVRESTISKTETRTASVGATATNKIATVRLFSNNGQNFTSTDSVKLSVVVIGRWKN